MIVMYMEKICAGFVEIHNGTARIIQLDPNAFRNPTFGLWDGGGDQLIVALAESSLRSPETIFRVLKQDGMSSESLDIFNSLPHQSNVVYITPSIMEDLEVPPNLKVLYSCWNSHYLPEKPSPIPVEHTIQKVCYRGQLSSDIRKEIVEKFKDHPYADFKLTKGTWHPEYHSDPHKLSITEQRAYRGILMLDGTAFPANAEWVLGSGSVPVMHSHYHTGLQMDMKPWVHYVPLSEDNIRWIFENPTDADEIIKNAKKLHGEIRKNVYKQLTLL